MPKKCLLILLDGLGDRAHEALNGLTPLQAAATPAFDALAAAGSCGLYHAGFAGQAMPSELAHTLLFGYPESAFPGRGVLEALGADLDMGERDVAIMARLVQAEEARGALRLVRDTPAGDSGEFEQLAARLPNMEIEGLRLEYRHVKGRDGLILIRPGTVAPSPLITDTNPIRDEAMLIEPRPLAEAGDDPAARATASALKRYLLAAYEALSKHPVNKARDGRGLPAANFLATQRAGRLCPVTPFTGRYGLKGAVMASGGVYKGLARHLGMDFIRVRDGDDPGADLAKRLARAGGALAEYDFVHVHTKAPDAAAHTKDPEAKRHVIENLDRGAKEILADLAGAPDLLVVVTADHSTPSRGALIHSGEPVPVIMHGSGVRRDAVSRFDEISAAAGALGFMRGPELMFMILNYLDKARLLGLRDCVEPFGEVPAWPGEYEPFRLE